LEEAEDKNRFKHMRPKRYPLTRGNDLLLKGIGVAYLSRAATAVNFR
jgi:hypothetical protein